MRLVGVICEGVLEWHLPPGQGTYATLCNMDGNDPNPLVDQLPGPPAPKGQRCTCRDCFSIWQHCIALALTVTDFATKARRR